MEMDPSAPGYIKLRKNPVRGQTVRCDTATGSVRFPNTTRSFVSGYFRGAHLPRREIAANVFL